MKQVWLQSILIVAVAAICGSANTAHAQGGCCGGPAPYYSPVAVQPYVAYSAPYAYGGYGYGGYGLGYPHAAGYGAGYPYGAYYGLAYPSYGYGYYGWGYGYGPRVIRERYNYGLFGNYNYHYRARW